jgi:hypothetical protein
VIAKRAWLHDDDGIADATLLAVLDTGHVKSLAGCKHCCRQQDRNEQEHPETPTVPQSFHVDISVEETE